MVPLDSHDDTGKGDNPRHTRCGWFYLVLLMTPRQAEEVVPFVMLRLEDEFCFLGFRPPASPARCYVGFYEYSILKSSLCSVKLTEFRASKHTIN